MSTQELSAIGYDNKSPKFNGNNYAWWKNRIQNVIMGIDYECWLVVKNGPNIILKTDVEGNQVPKKDSELVTADYKLLEKNAKAMSILQQAIEYEELLTFPRMKDLINVQNSQGKTPLHLAVQNRILPLTETLLGMEKIAYNIKDEDQNTPIDLLEQACTDDSKWDKAFPCCEGSSSQKVE
uniref:Uncharacterized protein n=1 Tax=Chenopodium quinoa TaxID=63459 RepID=A0A803L0P8_CHEQI